MVSGPLKKSINNSGLGYIKRIMTGGAPFLGGERYLVFGTELHLRALKRRKGVWKAYDQDEEDAMKGIMKSLMACKLFTDNFQGATIEQLHKKPMAFDIHGMHGTLDLKKPKRGGKRIIDLKTTSCATEEEFIKKAIALDYPRQGVVYEELDNPRPDDECYFIGCSKKNIGTKQKPKYPLFILDLNNFQNEKRTATNEAEFFLTFYDQYGLPTKSGLKRERPQKQFLR
jgi:hypothetical protein